MTFDERLAALGVDLSDLPRKWLTCVSEPYSGEQCYKAHGVAWAWYVGEDQRDVPELEQQETTRDRMILRQYILHLIDIIDRMETRLDNQTTLLKNLLHVIANADIPESVTYEQFCLVVDSIYKAVQLAQEGWETYEAGIPKEGSVWEGESDNA